MLSINEMKTICLNNGLSFERNFGCDYYSFIDNFVVAIDVDDSVRLFEYWNAKNGLLHGKVLMDNEEICDIIKDKTSLNKFIEESITAIAEHLRQERKRLVKEL